MENPDRRSRLIQACGLAAMCGTTLVASLVVGCAIGRWLDICLGTTPIMVVLGFLLGMVAGFTELFRIVRRIEGVMHGDNGANEPRR